MISQFRRPKVRSLSLECRALGGDVLSPFPSTGFSLPSALQCLLGQLSTQGVICVCLLLFLI